MFGWCTFIRNILTLYFLYYFNVNMCKGITSQKTTFPTKSVFMYQISSSQQKTWGLQNVQDWAGDKTCPLLRRKTITNQWSLESVKSYLLHALPNTMSDKKCHNFNMIWNVLFNIQFNHLAPHVMQVWDHCLIQEGLELFAWSYFKLRCQWLAVGRVDVGKMIHKSCPAAIVSEPYPFSVSILNCNWKISA